MLPMQRASRSVACARGRDRGFLHPGLVTALLLLELPVLPAQATIAPAFDLPRLDGRGTVSAADLFAAHEHTFLVFWWSGCTHCRTALASCEAFHREQPSDVTAVVGIDGEDTDFFEARAVVAASGVTFPQLRDPGGVVAAAYGLPSGTPSVCLVGRNGEILETRIDPPGDFSSAMRAMLSPAHSAETAANPQPAAGSASSNNSPWAGIALSGWQRIRFLGIDARGALATGPYGEPLESGNSLDYRLEVEAAKRLAHALRVGGLLRIGNEGEEVLDSGPKYFGSEWGSAFAAYDAPRLGVRAGYFTMFMTPLTLMRWDWDDSPRTAGSSGCGCGAVGGELLIESLDDLGPDLTFEGGIARAGFAGVETRAFFAIPRRALETTYTAWRTGGATRARYTLQLYGFEVRWQMMDARSGGFWRVGAHLAGTWEDRRSVDFGALGYPASDPWTESLVATATAEIPVVRFTHLRGEIVAWNRSAEHFSMPDGNGLDVVREGAGGVGGVVFEKPEGLAVKLDYLRLDGAYHAPFAALSYEPDQEGVRVSAELPVPRAGDWMSLFYKRTREVDPPQADTPRAQSELWGVALDTRVAGGLGAGAGWIDDRRWRAGDLAPLDGRRQVLTGRLYYELGRLGVAELQYQHTTNRETLSGIRAEATADLYVVQSTLEF